MASEPKAPPPETTPAAAPVAATPKRAQGIRVFTYPKVIFIFPTFVVSLICGIGMQVLGDKTEYSARQPRAAARTAPSDKKSEPAGNKAAKTEGKEKVETQTAKSDSGDIALSPETDRALTVVPPTPKHHRFRTPQNLFGILFLGVFAFNLLIMGLDFPRFTVVGIFLMGLFATFFILWLGAYFDLNLMHSVYLIMGGIYVVANAEFYFMVALILFVLFVIVYLTRWLDYWEILPNEILHHHGPLSDLERLPTLNLKFDKEIPDVLEFLFLGAGRLVLHVSDERKAIVLDNVLWINQKEEMLKRLMSRLEVRITTDQEVGGDR